LIARLGSMKYPYFKFSIANPRPVFETECAQYVRHTVARHRWDIPVVR
jgi:hypothetical protein